MGERKTTCYPRDLRWGMKTTRHGIRRLELVKSNGARSTGRNLGRCTGAYLWSPGFEPDSPVSSGLLLTAYMRMGRPNTMREVATVSLNVRYSTHQNSDLPQSFSKGASDLGWLISYMNLFSICFGNPSEYSCLGISILLLTELLSFHFFSKF